MELIYTDSQYRMLGVLREFAYDGVFGDGGSDFELTVPQGVEIQCGAVVYEHGTGIGGIVDSLTFDNTGDVPVIAYKGRTWNGILDASVTRPNSGQAYLVLTGDINAAIGTIISRADLGDVFSSASNAGVSVSYQVPRYVTAWEAIRRLCAAYGMRPQLKRGNGKTIVEAVQKRDYSDGSVSDVRNIIVATRNHRPVNHLVVLGTGELAARTVMDVFADANGNISQTQTLFGVDEVAEVYENTNEEDASKLLEDAKKKLSELQGFASVDISTRSNQGYEIGDTVTAYSVETGIRATSEVVRVIVTVNEGGITYYDYELSEPQVRYYR